MGIVIKIKGKTGQKVHENAKYVEQMSIFIKTIFHFPDFSRDF